MRAKLHRLLLMLLMLALPLQAFASAAMFGCAFSHQAEMEQMAAAGDTMAGCHESGQPEHAPASHDCPHCSACALGAVLPIAAGDRLPLLAVPTGLISHPAAAFSGFVPDGPERPPRRFPA